MPQSIRFPGDEHLGAVGPTVGPGYFDAEMGRRLEDWIVSTLDARGATPFEADWEGRLGRFSPLHHVPRTRNGRLGTAMEPGGWPRFRIASGRGITVVILTDEALVREHDLRELVDDLLALVEAGHHRIVLDFAGVDRLSIHAAGSLAEPVRRCSAAQGGALRVCGLRPEVSAVFATAGLGVRTEVYPDVASAIGGPWPEAPALRPLPVSVLSALTRSVLRGRHEPPDASAFEVPPAMTAARLVAQTDPERGRAVVVDGRRFVIGRASDCRLRLGFATVSRHHATIERRGGRLELVDLGSTNGSFLNGRPLRNEAAEIRDGDRVQFGPMIFVVEVDDDVPVTTAADPHGAGIDVDGWLAGPVSEDPATSTGFFVPSYGIVDGAGEGAPIADDTLQEFGLKCEAMRDVVVVTPQVAGLDDEPSIDALRDGLDALFDRTPIRRVVVNLVHAGRISGRAIGVLLAHHLRLDRAGGALRVCQANARVAAMLDGVRLGMLVECHPTVEGAVLAAWPTDGSSIGRA